MKNVLAGGKKNVVHLCTTTSCSSHCYFFAGLVCSGCCLEHLVDLQSRAKRKKYIYVFREVSPKCSFLPLDRSCRLLNPRIETSGFLVLNREIRLARGSRGEGGSGTGSSPAAGAFLGRFLKCTSAFKVTLGVNRSAQQCGSLPFYVGTFLTVPFKQA